MTVWYDMPGHREAILLSLVACALVTPRVDAQGHVYPRLDLTLGPHGIRTTYRGARAPATTSDNGSNTLAGVSLGVGVSRQVAMDVGYRAAIGGDWTFEVMTLGFTVRSRGRTGATLGFGIGGLSGEEDEACGPAPTCPGPKRRWQGGFQLSFGVDHPLGTRVAVGPVLWWAQTMRGPPHYRSMGLGLHLALF